MKCKSIIEIEKELRKGKHEKKGPFVPVARPGTKGHPLWSRTGVSGWETGTTGVSQPGQINVFVVVAKALPTVVGDTITCFHPMKYCLSQYDLSSGSWSPAMDQCSLRAGTEQGPCSFVHHIFTCCSPRQWYDVVGVSLLDLHLVISLASSHLIFHCAN